MKPPPKAEDEQHRSSWKLKGKVALISGGNSGIGRAVAIAFAKEAADVSIVCLNEHKDAKRDAAARPGPRRKVYTAPARRQRNREYHVGDCIQGKSVAASLLRNQRRHRRLHPITLASARGKEYSGQWSRPRSDLDTVDSLDVSWRESRNVWQRHTGETRRSAGRGGALLCFLASDDSSYMTGQVLHPNGGTIVNG